MKKIISKMLVYFMVLFSSTLVGKIQLTYGAENLLVNPSFEIDAFDSDPKVSFPYYWELISPFINSYSLDENEQYFGNKALKFYMPLITKNPSFDYSGIIGGVSQSVRLDPDKSYTLSYYIKADYPEYAIARPTVWFSQEYKKDMKIPLTTGWQRIKFTFTTPSDIGKGKIELKTQIISGPTTIWIDGVQLEESDITTDFIDTGLNLSLENLYLETDKVIQLEGESLKSNITVTEENWFPIPVNFGNNSVQQQATLRATGERVTLATVEAIGNGNNVLIRGIKNAATGSHRSYTNYAFGDGYHSIASFAEDFQIPSGATKFYVDLWFNFMNSPFTISECFLDFGFGNLHPVPIFSIDLRGASVINQNCYALGNIMGSHRLRFWMDISAKIFELQIDENEKISYYWPYQLWGGIGAFSVFGGVYPTGQIWGPDWPYSWYECYGPSFFSTEAGTFLLSINNVEIKCNVPKTQVIVCLDAGHGGGDPGAVGPTGLKEKDANFMISTLTLGKFFNPLDMLKYKLHITRTGDQKVKLSERVRKANSNFREKSYKKVYLPERADVFVSIHNNASTKSYVSGAETLYYTSPKTDYWGNVREDRPLADDIFTYLITTANNPGPNGVWAPNKMVTRETKMPAAISESAYISNPEEEDELRNNSDNFLDKIAEAIYSAIKEYVRVYIDPYLE